MVALKWKGWEMSIWAPKWETERGSERPEWRVLSGWGGGGGEPMLELEVSASFSELSLSDAGSSTHILTAAPCLVTALLGPFNNIHVHFRFNVNFTQVQPVQLHSASFTCSHIPSGFCVIQSIAHTGISCLMKSCRDNNALVFCFFLSYLKIRKHWTFD